MPKKTCTTDRFGEVDDCDPCDTVCKSDCRNCAIQECFTRLGEYKCLVKTRYGFCCDLCLEDEILLLRSKGIHTVGCCCGHGNEELSYIQTVSENSKKMMEDMGYKQTNIKPVKGDAWFPKSNLLYDKGGSK